MKKYTRRDFIKSSAAATALAAMGNAPFFVRSARAGRAAGRRVIVVGFDGVDPFLCELLMQQGRLPNLSRLRERGGYRRLGTSNPPQSPVAWANFINGAGPGSHGIFDFIHRDPKRQAYPFFAAAETMPGLGYVEMGAYKVQFDFWPFKHVPPRTLLRRDGVPFWDYLDAAGIPSTFYCLPSNYPPSPSRHGNHRCLSGMGTPDLLGSYGTYQYFGEDAPAVPLNEGGGRRTHLSFDGDSSRAFAIIGPPNTFLQTPQPAEVQCRVHRDRGARAAVLEVGGRTVLLKQGDWSPWVDIEFNLATPAVTPDHKVNGIVRFYLQQVEPVFKLYVSPVNADPRSPAIAISEPPGFVTGIADRLGAFYTTGFQEDHKALSNKIFNDDEFARQAGMVLQERMRLYEHALSDYDDGLLFFYFSSTDMQAHMFWWDTDAPHPYRTPSQARHYFNHVHEIYERMDAIVGDLVRRYGEKAHIMIMSDHGFSNFRRQFNINTWLRDNGYLGPPDCTGILSDVDWRKSRAFGLGINSLYLNMKGREVYGIVEPGRERDQLLDELVRKLEAVRDTDGRRVIRTVYRSDQIYQGPSLTYAPDLVIGYTRDYRCSWEACLGDITKDALLDNTSAWAADHCMDPVELPGVLFSNRPVAAPDANLTDIGPSILAHFGLSVPGQMTGKNIFKL
jgi:predicted AlkP superfamily phosphohydrolase/phosphomutase